MSNLLIDRDGGSGGRPQEVVAFMLDIEDSSLDAVARGRMKPWVLRDNLATACAMCHPHEIDAYEHFRAIRQDMRRESC